MNSESPAITPMTTTPGTDVDVEGETWPQETTAHAIPASVGTGASIAAIGLTSGAAESADPGSRQPRAVAANAISSQRQALRIPIA